MQERSRRCLILSSLLAFTLQPLSAQSKPATPAPPDDAAYAPLQLYDGSWESATAGGKTIHLTNHCARTGRFYVCEQVVDGQSQALVIFLPQGASGPTQNYLTEVLTTNATQPGGWNKLEISGDHWLYSSEAQENGAKVYWRTVNVFTGKDQIHFEIQRSADGQAWTTTMSGDERRKP